jgi:GT2 family glycosyltransferase
MTPRSALSAADVTVAVATINRPSALARCVAAVMAGEAVPGQLVIVDQSAETATADLVAAAGWDRLVPLTYVRQSHQGLAASRNEAIAHAVKQIVAFTDDDCVPDRRWLTRVVAAFAGPDQPDVVTGPVLPLGPDLPGLYAVSTRTSRERTVYRGRALPWNVGTGGNTTASREWLHRVGGFDERLGAGSPGQSAEDTDLLYRLLRAGAMAQYEPGAVVYHERKDSSRLLASSSTYGFGMGAFCALWARRRDVFAVWMLGRWCYDRGRALIGACVRRRVRRIREELLMLHGLACGIAYGLTLDVGGKGTAE